ncbi:MAG: PD-(D/E)XK nuclease family protein [Anaerolineae bacterium]
MVWGGVSLGLVLVLLAAAGWLWFSSRRLREQTGLPDGEVIYTDTGIWYRNNESLHITDLRLVGKPDYLVEATDGAIIPVEVKSGRAPEEPWEGHLLQLAAYCLLVDENYGRRPSYGILQYRDKAFAVDYTEEMEAALLQVLSEMRNARFDEELDRDHNEWQRCARCGVRSACEQRLG